MKSAKRDARRRASACCASKTKTKSPPPHRSGKSLRSRKKRSRGTRRKQNKIARMSGAIQPLQPMFTTHLFPKLEEKLIALLQGLAPEDWEKQTLAPKWKVKDVAAHLLDTQIRKLSAARHGYKSENSKKLSPAKLVALINSLNAEGVRQYSRLNPNDLISRMEAASK